MEKISDPNKDSQDGSRFSRWLLQNKGYMRQTLVCCAVSTLSFAQGMMQGWPSLALERIRNGAAGFLVTNHDISIIVSVTTFGMFVIPVVFGFIIMRLGRITNLLIAAMIYILAWTLIIFAKSPVWLMAANFVVGFGGGIVLIIGPIYMAEIAHKRIRGALISIYITSIGVGAIFMTSVGMFIPYRELNILGFILAIFSLLSILFLAVESPSWHLMQNDDEKAQRCFKYYWKSSKDTDAVDEPACLLELSVDLADLKKTVQTEMNSMCSYRELFGTPSNVRALIIVVALFIVQGASGSTAITAYGSSTLPKYDGFWQPNPTMALYSILNVVFSILSIKIIDKLGRKPLSIISNAGDALGTGMIATYFFIERYTSWDTTNIKWLPSVGTLVYISFFGSGMGTIPHILAGELFPVNVRYHASVVAACFEGPICALLNYIYFDVSHYAGVCVMYMFFTMCSISAIFFSVGYVYETKSMSLAEIQVMGFAQKSRSKKLSFAFRLKVMSFSNYRASNNEITELPSK